MSLKAGLLLRHPQGVREVFPHRLEMAAAGPDTTSSQNGGQRPDGGKRALFLLASFFGSEERVLEIPPRGCFILLPALGRGEWKDRDQHALGMDGWVQFPLGANAPPFT